MAGRGPGGAGDPGKLPPKDQKLFREATKLYETKQYRRALKTVDKLLEKHPKHAESMAIKALVTAHSDPNSKELKAEAFKLAKLALALDVRSHLCWHVFGLLHKLDRNYAEAVKCYMNTLRLDSENGPILRDLANIQIQTRDLAGFLESRQKMLTANPKIMGNWVALAVAHHLNGNHDVALAILDRMRAASSDAAEDPYEASELHMYRVHVLEDKGDLEGALAHLDAHASAITDLPSMLGARASLLLRLGRKDEAAEAYRALLARNTENFAYHDGLRRAMGLPGTDAPGPASDATLPRLRALYAELAAAHPKSNACRRLPLDFLAGSEFREAASDYIGAWVRRGVPSLFSALRPLYADAAKAAALGEIAAELLESAGASGGAGDDPAARERRAWLLHFLSQHRGVVGDLEGALEACDEARGLAPEEPELHANRAALLEAAGDLHGAAAAAEEARSKDASDRYMNSVAVAQLLRAGRVAKAESVAGVFTREGNGINNLYDMQAAWYEIEAARAHVQQGREGDETGHGKALKKLFAVFRHYEDFEEDQFDFHGYCMRKMTLRSYLDMLEVSNKIYRHPRFLEAATLAVDILCELHDTPALRRSPEEREAAVLEGMDKAERKKYRAEKKKEQEEALRAAKRGERPPPGWAPRGERDADPDGGVLVSTIDPLSEAAKLVARLRQFGGGRLESHKAAFEVHMRRGRRLLALQAVQKAAGLAGRESPDVARMAARLAAAGAQGEEDAPAVAEILKSGTEALLGAEGATAKAYAEAWAAQHGKASVGHALAAAEARAVTGVCGGEAAAAELVSVVEALLASAASKARSTPAEDLRGCEAVYAALLDKRSPLHCPGEAERLRGVCARAFPRALRFGGQKATPPPGVEEGVAALTVA
ncbi:unnamed protein product [Pedinophyceae sp. YPF-701]|nr:unnamed protein product [Pedinophyceae sp. YPF-701]